MFGYIRRWFCRHGSYVITGHRTDGVTLGWGMTPAVVQVWSKRCKDCGAEFQTSGVLPRAACTAKRDFDDWPLNDDGSRMKISAIEEPDVRL